ncbi:hypothetical protein N6H18_18175 [Reichenbachiella agarivorans]|uniref:Short chain amide porin n=1 Tax=Reichenbachiella agarivorans TaxID=2979464 RepID=A0ABY6CPH4_9BACT|nr:hypothetical protein [Reichenbachiella agarivorans]UXP32269.1 hypothetical protein N6H18_18175 [Reichenbachiella agarivorans]
MKTPSKSMIKRLITVLLSVLFTATCPFSLMTFAQSDSKLPVLKLGNQSQLKFSASAQFWLRATELNPGTTIQGEAQDYVSDVSIRRLRLAISGNVTGRWYVKFQLGANNLNYINNNSTLKILDLETSYRFADAFELGGGKNGYVGLSRYAAPATCTGLSLDYPTFIMPTVNISDDLLRKFSLYAKGYLGQFAYRAVVARPMVVSQTELSEQTNFYSNFPQLQYSAYLSYQFFERESQKSAYQVATYLGSKKVMNLNAGFLYQSDALSGLGALQDTVSYDMLLLAMDFFLDISLDAHNYRSITAYLGYFDYDFGQDYIRHYGTNNPANGVTQGSLSGAGNSFPTTGTGQILYAQFGYKTHISHNEKIPALQPFFSAQYARYDALSDPMIMCDYGINILLNGQNSKLTLGVQNRPIYSNQNNDYSQVTDRMNMWVFQYQIKL